MNLMGVFLNLTLVLKSMCLYKTLTSTRRETKRNVPEQSVVIKTIQQGSSLEKRLGYLLIPYR